MHIEAIVEESNESNRVVHDDDQVVDDESTDEPDHDVADDQVLVHVIDEAAEADQSTDEEVDANLVDKVLPVDHVVLPFALNEDERQHDHRGNEQKHATEEYVELVSRHEDNDD